MARPLLEPSSTWLFQPSPGLTNSVAIHRNYFHLLLPLLVFFDAIGHDGHAGAFLLLHVYKDIMPVVYAVEGSSSVAHPHVAYATDETLLAHTFCYGPSFYASFCCMFGFIARGLIAFVAISRI